MVAPFIVDGRMNAAIFVTYLKECLVPKLKRGDVVMMNSLLVHKVAAVRQVIEAVRAKLRYLPKYSPDLNLIEQAFSKLKKYLRKAAEPTIPRFSRRIGAFASAFSPQECTNYFRYAGYAST
jgi:transposase